MNLRMNPTKWFMHPYVPLYASVGTFHTGSVRRTGAGDESVAVTNSSKDQKDWTAVVGTVYKQPAGPPNSN